MGDYLTLVNDRHKFSRDMLSGFEFVDIVDNFGDKSYVELKTLENFNSLAAALRAQGIKITINSAGRTVEDQKRAFLELEKTHGTEYAESHTALPYHSEHHTGLAIDVKLESIKGGLIRRGIFGKVHEKLTHEKRDMYDVLHALMPEYGFIERYTEAKQDITHVPPERWHMRYVGRDNALNITASGLSLEEYVATHEQVRAS